MRLEKDTLDRTRGALKRIAKAIAARSGATEALSRGGVDLPASLPGPDARREAKYMDILIQRIQLGHRG